MSTDDKVNVSSQGIGLSGLMFIVLFVLKMGVGETAVVSWSWWWITVPLWGPLACVFTLALVFVVVIALFLCCKYCFQLIKNKKKTKKE